jgi:hypothetical protein
MKAHVVLAAALVCSAAFAQSRKVPGWFQSGINRSGYEVGVDGEVVRSGKGAASIRCVEPKGCKDFGTLMQTFRADEYRGRRMRLTAWVKAEQVTSTSIWMRVDAPDATLAFDNMQRRALWGTSKGWRLQTIVLDVAEDAVTINYGIMLVGKGHAWADDFQFEVVDKKVRTTDMYTGPRPASQPLVWEKVAALPGVPVNTDFEQ